MSAEFTSLFFNSETSDQHAALLLSQALSKAPHDIDSLHFHRLCLEDPLTPHETARQTISLNLSPHGDSSDIENQNPSTLDTTSALAAGEIPFMKPFTTHSREDINAYIAAQLSQALRPAPTEQRLSGRAFVRSKPADTAPTLAAPQPSNVFANVQPIVNPDPVACEQRAKPKGSLQNLVGTRPHEPTNERKWSKPQTRSHRQSPSGVYQRNPGRKRVYERDLRVEEESDEEQVASAFVSARTKWKKTQRKQPGWNRSNSCNSADSDPSVNRQAHPGQNKRKRHRTRFKPPARLNEQNNSSAERGPRRRPGNGGTHSSRPGGE